MEFISGKPVNEWIESASEKQKETMAHNFMNLYLAEFFIHGLVQTDPNPGNFLITADDRIALLDFGAVRQYSPEFINGYKRIIKASIEGNEELVLKESYQLGFIDERESVEVKTIYLDLMRLSTDLFGMVEAQDFSDKSFINKSQKLSWALIRHCHYTPPPKDIIFLHRKLAGVFVIFRRLNVQVVLKDFWDAIAKD